MGSEWFWQCCLAPTMGICNEGSWKRSPTARSPLPRRDLWTMPILGFIEQRLGDWGRMWEAICGAKWWSPFLFLKHQNRTDDFRFSGHKLGSANFVLGYTEGPVVFFWGGNRPIVGVHFVCCKTFFCSPVLDSKRCHHSGVQICFWSKSWPQPFLPGLKN